MRGLAALVALGLLLGGCGQRAADQPIDVAGLDSGNYPTQPVAIPSQPGFDDAVFREGLRLAEHVPLPHEADPQLRFGRGWPGLISTGRRPPSLMGPSGAFTPAAPGFVAGAATEGQRRASAAYGRALQQKVLRFDSDAAAERAVQALAGAALTEAGTEPLSVAGHPRARGVWRPAASQRMASYAAWAARGSLVLYAYCFDPLSVPPDPAAGSGWLGAALTRQAEYLAGYQPTPLTEISKLPVDIDDMLARTLPRDGKADRRADPPAVYGIRAAAAYTYDPPETMDALRAAGADLVATSGSTVVRARDAAAASDLVKHFASRYPEDYDSAPAPPGLDSAKCVAQPEKPRGDRSLLPRYQCYLSYGRYYAKVSGNNQQDTHQRTAAQYKILVNVR